MSILHQIYKDEIQKKMTEKFQYKNSMEIPKIVKICVNMGLGEAIQNAKVLESAEKDLATITGQKPVITKAKKSIASFKLRSGMSIGCFVTLRREKMYEFMSKLINVALPRVRDFKGVSKKAFDGRGNYSLGLKDQLIFPEIEYEKIDAFRGMSITIVTNAKTDEECHYLLECFGMPFKK